MAELVCSLNEVKALVLTVPAGFSGAAPANTLFMSLLFWEDVCLPEVVFFDFAELKFEVFDFKWMFDGSLTYLCTSVSIDDLVSWSAS